MNVALNYLEKDELDACAAQLSALCGVFTDVTSRCDDRDQYSWLLLAQMTEVNRLLRARLRDKIKFCRANHVTDSHHDALRALYRLYRRSQHGLCLAQRRLHAERDESQAPLAVDHYSWAIIA